MFTKLFSNKRSIVKFVFIIFLFYTCIYISKYLAGSVTSLIKLFIISLAFAAIYFVLTQPQKSFYIFIFMLPFVEFPRITKMDAINTVNVFAAILIFTVLAQGAFKGKIKIYNSYLSLPIAALFTVILLSLIQTRHITSVHYVIKEAWFNLPYNRSIFQILLFLLMVLIFYVSCNFLKSKEDLFKAIKIWIYASVFVSILGILGYLGHFFNIPFSNHFISTQFAEGLLINIPRIKSTLKEPIFLGLYLMISIPLLISLIINKIKIFSSKKLILFLFLQILTLFLTFARGAWIALAIASSVIFLISSKNMSRSIRLIVSLAVVLLFCVLIINVAIPTLSVSNYVSERFFSVFAGTDFSALTRLDAILTAINIFKAYPWLGVGYGNFYFRAEEFAPPIHKILFAWVDTWDFTDAQNLFLTFLAETGIFGFLIVLWLFVVLLINLYKFIKLSNGTNWLPYFVGYFGGLIGIFIIYQFVFIINLAFIWVLFAIIISTQRIFLEDTINHREHRVL